MRSHCIYRIVNVVNGKCYVGQTNDAKRRQRDHFRDLRNNCHGNSHLQHAFNNYGAHSFYFEILERGISTANVNSREQFWIAEFKAYTSGYNKTAGGDGHLGHGKKCVWNGVEYPTIKAAALANEVDPPTMRVRIRTGKRSDNDITLNGKCITWNGIQYNSLTEAAIATGRSWDSMQHFIAVGYTCDDDVKAIGGNNAIAVMWNGVIFPSMKAAAKANSIPHATMKRWIDKGYTCDSDTSPNSIVRRHPSLPCRNFILAIKQLLKHNRELERRAATQRQ